MGRHETDRVRQARLLRRALKPRRTARRDGSRRPNFTETDMTDYNHPDPARRDRVSPAAVNTPQSAADPSLQPHVHAVAASRTSPRRGTGKLVVGGAVIAGIIALWQFGPRFGWGPGGRGPGSGL